MRTETTYGITVSASTTGNGSTEAAKGSDMFYTIFLEIKERSICNFDLGTSLQWHPTKQDFDVRKKLPVFDAHGNFPQLQQQTKLPVTITLQTSKIKGTLKWYVMIIISK